MPPYPPLGKILPGHAPTAKHSSRSGNLRLIAPVDGVVAVRDADPGTTIVAGQAVVEVIDPKSLWINVRFDQISASGLAGGCRLISSCVRVVARP
jgi:hypothetical protein